MSANPTLFDDQLEPDPLPAVPGWARDLNLAEIQDVLRDLLDDGASCPCCGQLAKIYKRRVNSGMARSLITMWRRAGTEWAYIPEVIGAKSREEGKLAYWGLLEEATDKRDDGGRAGWWRITTQGKQFVHNLIKIPRYARIYDGHLLGFTGEYVTIYDALGAKFDYELLMRGEA